MSHEPHAEVRSPAVRLRAWSKRVIELVERRLADARSHAEHGRLADANERLLDLRTGLVGRSPGDEAGLLRNARAPFRGRAATVRPSRLEPSFHRDEPDGPAVTVARADIAPTGGRNEWLEAIQLSAQAISDLASVSAASNAARPEIRSAALAAWEARHRNRIARWARLALADSQAALHGDIGGSGAEAASGLHRWMVVSSDPPLHAVRSRTPSHADTSSEAGPCVFPGSSRAEGSP